MKNLIAVLLLSMVIFAACKKDTARDCSPVNIVAPASEVDSLRSYLNENSITATEDPRGFFYTINTAGSDKPTVCNTVTVTYAGRLTNGTQFDANSNVSFPLSTLILGWQEGIPLIGSGGSITLYLPPSLAYGNVDYGSIPANSILVFDISLTAIN